MVTKYQLCSTDEYGQTGIHPVNGKITSENINDVIKAAKDQVTAINDNSLTADERKRNYEAYFVEMIDSKEVYAGKNGHGQHIGYRIDDNEVETFKSEDSEVRIYIGKMERKETYADDIKGKALESIKHSDLSGKTVWFVRKVG
jgi:hypothetical protein